MHYWQIIIDEVASYEQKGFRCRYSNLQETDIFTEKLDNDCSPKPPKRQKVTYPLPPPYDHLYLTEREAECIFCLQHSQTIKSTGTLLNLSARTVEFYLKNIKTKTGMRTKSEILQLLQNHRFDQHENIHDELLDLIKIFHLPSRPTTTHNPTPTYYC